MFGSLRRIAAWSLAVAGLVAGSTSSAEANPQRVYRKVLPSVMTLEVENQSGRRFVGSAVMTLADDTAITAWHVVNDARSVWATFQDGTRVKVSGWIDRDPERDLALIKLEKPLPGRRVNLSPNLEEVAARAYVIGAPKGYGFSISDGLVSQVRQLDGFAQYQISCPISAGNSGGPVLNERGQVIGIVSWTKSDAQNVSFAVPSREAARLKAGNALTVWEQPVPLPQLSMISSATNSALSEVAVSAERKESPASDFSDLTRRLSQSAGKKVTVVVQEDGQENKFTFTVPRGLK
jgi:S1-C subfamily serine protease